MSLATSTMPRVARNPRPATLATLLRRHERLLALLGSAVARHGLIVDEDEGSDVTTYGYVTGRDDQHPAVAAASLATWESRKRITWALLNRYPDTPIPSWQDWHHSTKPIIRHLEGNKLVLLVSGDDGDCHQGALHPIEDDEVVWWSRLVIVDLD